MRKNAEANRARILAAAGEVFGAHGAAGSTEDVARRAGVGIATVFRHFPTKEALVEAALLEHFAVLNEEAGALAGEADPGPALRELVARMIATGATKITLASLVGFPPSVEAAAAELRATVAGIVERAKAAGAVHADITVDEVYLLIRGLAQATATMPASPATTRRAIDVVLRGLAAEGGQARGTGFRRAPPEGTSAQPAAGSSRGAD
jgi:AcrR family transcriptional regulator